MPKASKARSSVRKERVVDFLIEAEGRRKRILTVRESKKDDLLVTMKRGALAGGHPRSGGREAGAPDLIRESRYTIHPSLRSIDGNQINYHYAGRGGEQFKGVFWTDAMKKKGGFAPITMVWVADVRSPTFDPPMRRPTHAVDLGAYEPEHFRLRYLLVASAPDRAFEVPPGENVNAADFEFNRFRLTLLWNFAPFPSDARGLITGWESVRDPDTGGLDYWSEPFITLFFNHTAQQGVAELLEPIYANHEWLRRSSRHGLLRNYAAALQAREAGAGGRNSVPGNEAKEKE